MIVKDESHIISQTLRNIAKHIPIEHYVICDTGSTDNTIDIIEKTMLELEIPGKIFRHKWVNFSHNRNLALNLAREYAQYAFIFDADDSIVFESNGLNTKQYVFGLDELDAPGYSFIFGSGNCSYIRNLLVNLDYQWYFRGVLHEVIVCNAIDSVKCITGNYHIISGRTGNRNKDPLKYQKDALIFEEAINDPETPRDLLSRYAFYCAQSWYDFRNTKKALEWYNLCINKYDNWNEEKYYASLRIATIYKERKEYEKAIMYALYACEYNTLRLEGTHLAANIAFYELDRKHLANTLIKTQLHIAMETIRPLDSFLFAYIDVYKYEYISDALLFSHYDNDIETVKQCFTELSKRINTFNGETKLVMNYCNNLSYYFNDLITVKCEESYVIELYTHIQNLLINISRPYAKEQLEHIYKTFQSVNNVITTIAKQNCYSSNTSTSTMVTNISLESSSESIITIIVHKDTQYLCQTIQSMLDNILDIQSARSIYVFVETSEQQDMINDAKLLFPFIRFVNIVELQKSIVTKSTKIRNMTMNYIREIVLKSGAKYWMYIDRDLLFIEKREYLSECTTVLKKMSEKIPEYLNYNDKLKLKLKQVVFNKCYGETLCDVLMSNGDQIDGIFLLHDKEETNLITNKKNLKHFSLCPGITDISVLKDIGVFDHNSSCYEEIYAEKYYNLGYRTAYYSRVNCLYTGEEHKQEYNELHTNQVIELLKNITCDNVTFTKDFIFVGGYDIYGNDIDRVELSRDKHTDPKYLYDEMNKNVDGCIAMNTLGYRKNQLGALVKSSYFGNNDGICIRRKIKL